MGIFDVIRIIRRARALTQGRVPAKTQARTRADIKAQARAQKAATKAAHKAAKKQAKLDKRTLELLDKAEKRLLKEEKQGLKRKRKHEKELAKTHMKRIENSGITKKKAKQATGAARALVPVLLPLAYKALTSWQQKQVDSRASGLGLSSQDLARHSGRGAELKARIEAVRQNVEQTESLGEGFKGDARVRLSELEQAVRNAEHANPEQRRLAHNSIDEDLTKLAADVREQLTKHAK